MPSTASNEDRLLRAALLCGLSADGLSVHRFQLYFVVQNQLGHRVGIQDLQRALETATGTKRLFSNPEPGRYRLTSLGEQTALDRHGPQEVILPPAPAGECRIDLVSPAIVGKEMVLNITDVSIRISLDRVHMSGPAARDWLNEHAGARIQGIKDSQPRRVYDYGFSAGWELFWRGPIEPVPEKGTVDSDELASQVARLRDARSKGVVMVTPNGCQAPERMNVETVAWRRLSAVVEYVLFRAMGRCEACGVEPFLGRDCQPFLEVHHVRPLASGGPDTIDNAVALCPNCHRALHHAHDRDARREALYLKVRELARS
jgi:hypothetical protein